MMTNKSNEDKTSDAASGQNEPVVMCEVLINGVKYFPEYEPEAAPLNKADATHWAALPDGSTLFYRVANEVLLWLPMSKNWISPGSVPYTLNSYRS